MRVVINLLAIPAYADRFRLLCTLSNHVDELTVLTDGLPNWARKISLNYGRLTVVELGRRSTAAKARRWLDTAISEKRVDVIHDTFGFLASSFQTYGPQGNRPFRLVTTLYTSNWQWFHNVRTREFDVGWTYMRQRISTLWRDRRVCRSADRVMVLGPGHERAIVQGHGVDAHRIVWCPAEIDVERFAPSDLANRRRPVLTYSGAVCRNKGIDILFEAAEVLKNRHIDFELRIIGRVLFWERAWFTDLCHRFELDDHVIHFGQVEHQEMLSLYQSSDFFVFPSRFEGSPRSVREALACGVPCILSNIPGNRGVDPEGHFVRFVDDWDGRLWADAIQACIDEPKELYRQRRLQSRQHMELHHDFQAVAKNWVKIYEDVLSEKPNTG